MIINGYNIEIVEGTPKQIAFAEDIINEIPKTIESNVNSLNDKKAALLNTGFTDTSLYDFELAAWEKVLTTLNEVTFAGLAAKPITARYVIDVLKSHLTSKNIIFAHQKMMEQMKKERNETK